MKKSTKITLGVIAGAAVVAAGVITAVSLSNQPSASEKLITTTIEQRTITSSVAASGEVQSADQLGVHFAVAGQVTDVVVDVGDTVSAGDVIATLDDVSYRAALESSRSSLASARDGVNVANLAEAQAQQAVNSADQAIAAAEQAIAAAEDANNSEAEATASRQLAAAQAQRTTAEYTQARVPGQKAAAQATLRAAEAGLEQAQANLEKATLRAPMDGTILSADLEVGDQVTTGGPDAFIIADLGGFEVVANFSESDIIGIQSGQSVQVDFDALPGGTTTGVVTEVGLLGQADPSGGSLTTYPVTVAVDNPPAQLRVGMSAQIDIILDESADVVAAPVAALNVRGEDIVVNVVREDGSIQEVVVETAGQGGNFVEIISGLQGGETVVIGDVGEFPVVSSDEEFDPATGPPPGVEDQERQQDAFN